ncbi:hypothetical protein [Actinomadura sp. 3N407]|uniref:hypothetical protein n=1 Tax=Actinomadura sp. 3N407 TaxID=3457423 RepID=UPI003FCD1F8A
MSSATIRRQRLEKELEDTGMKLSSVLSNIIGTSGRAILETLIKGERDPVRLADLARGKAGRKIGELTQALDGEFTAHHASRPGTTSIRTIT